MVEYGPRNDATATRRLLNLRTHELVLVQNQV